MRFALRRCIRLTSGRKIASASGKQAPGAITAAQASVSAGISLRDRTEMEPGGYSKNSPSGKYEEFRTLGFHRADGRPPLRDGSNEGATMKKIVMPFNPDA